MGKHSGRHAFQSKLEELGFDLGHNEMNDAFQRFKDLADHKKDVYDEDIVALVDDAVVRCHNDRIKFDLPCRWSAVPRVRRRRPWSSEVDGDGADRTRSPKATARSMPCSRRSCKIFPHDGRLQLYQVHAVTGGTDAQAEVTVRLEEAGKTVNGQGADYDTLVASARAYINALNKLLGQTGEDRAGGDLRLDLRPTKRRRRPSYRRRAAVSLSSVITL